MTSQNPAISLPAITRTPERRCPAREANLAAASTVEDELQALKAYFSEPFGELTSPTTVQTQLEQPVTSAQKRGRQTGDSSLMKAIPVLEPLDEEVEMCWPLSKETEGPPGRDLLKFKQFHHQAWKMFESAEDLITDEYLEILRRRDREALKRLVSRHLFDNAGPETKSKVQYALVEQALVNTTDASPVLRQKLLYTSPDYLSVMNIGLPNTPSTLQPLKRKHTTAEADGVSTYDLETPTRPAKMRKLVETPRLAKQWERHDGMGIYPPSDAVVEWCIDTRKGGKYEHLSCFTSASFPIKDSPFTSGTELLKPPVAESQSSGSLLPAVVITDTNLSKGASTALPSRQQRATVPTGAFTFSAETSGAAATTSRPIFSRPSATTAAHSQLSLADNVKLRKRACAKRLL